MQPNFDELASLKTTEDALKIDFEGKQKKAANLQAYQNQLQIMGERFGNMLKKLPSQNEMPALLEDISKTGIASGLTFQSFAPSPEVEHDFYYEMPIKITVIGTYQQLAMFISNIAKLGRIVTLHDIKIETITKENSGLEPTDLNKDQLVMSITAKIYRYRAR